MTCVIDPSVALAWLLPDESNSRADAVRVADRHEHHRLVRGNTKRVEPAGSAEDGFFFDSLDDAETVIRVDDLVTDLECHVSPVLGRVLSGGCRSRPIMSIQKAGTILKEIGHKRGRFAFISLLCWWEGGVSGRRLVRFLL